MIVGRNILKKSMAVFLMLLFSSFLFAEDLSTYTHVKPKVTTERTGKMSLTGNADDPAIWIHPTDPSRSLLFGVDKIEGVWVWTLDGKELHHFDPWGKPGNIDVRYGFNLGNRKVDIVALNLRKVKGASRTSKAAVYSINPDWTSGSDVLTVLADGRSSGNDIQTSTYGFTLFRDPKLDKIYVFEAPDSGAYQPKQYEIVSNAKGDGITLKHVRDLDYSGKVNEGMVADDEKGYVYIAEESLCVYKYFAAADADPKAVASFAYAEDGYRRDREGVALYNAGSGKGYILVVDQAAKAGGTFSIWRIYDRNTNSLVKTVVPLSDDGGYLWDQDGIDANPSPLPGFPHGIVVAHDGDAANHPVYDWADIAGEDLLRAGK